MTAGLWWPPACAITSHHHLTLPPHPSFQVFQQAVRRHPHFLHCSDFVLSYAELLVSRQDIRDARSLYERATAAMDHAVSKILAPDPGPSTTALDLDANQTLTPRLS